MALAGPDVLKKNILDLPKAPDPVSGALNFAGVVGDYMAKMQAGASGSPGILTFNSAIFGALVATMPPDPTGKAWGPLMATHWQTAMLASVIKPGTVTSPVWTASAVDTLTLPAAAATIITIPLAMATLASGLASAKPDETAPMPLAQAFHDACLKLTFTCIGLVLAPPAPPIPTPLPFGAM